MNRNLVVVLSVTIGVLLSAATAPNDIPHRKAGWWQMTMHMPGGRTMARNLCLDANSDIRNNVLKPQDGCTMTADRLPNGYKYKKACQGEVTTGTAIGDFNSAEGDRIQLDPGTHFVVSQVGADTVIDLGNGDRMILANVQLSTLPPGWIFGF